MPDLIDPNERQDHLFDDPLSHQYAANNGDSDRHLGSLHPNLQRESTGPYRSELFRRRRMTSLEAENMNLKRQTRFLKTELERWRFSAQQETQNAVELDKQHREEKEKTTKLAEQIFAFKQEISSTTHLERQLSDGTIQTAFCDLFCRVRNWALQTIDQRNPDIRVDSQHPFDWLADYVPHHADNNKLYKVHALLAIVAGAFAEAFGSTHVFGSAEDGPVASANNLYKVFYAGIQGQEKQTRQWLLLTRKLVSRLDGDLLGKANAAATDEILRLIQQRLEALSTLEINADIRQSLITAVTPGIELLQLLHDQLEDYLIKMIPAHEAGKDRVFDPQYMEDEGAEDAGSVKASLFPILYKMVNREDGTKERVLICKARVALHQLRNRSLEQSIR